MLALEQLAEKWLLWRRGGGGGGGGGRPTAPTPGWLRAWYYWSLIASTVLSCTIFELVKLQMVLNKAARYVFLPLSGTSTIDEMFESCDNTMFLAILHNPKMWPRCWR